MTSPGCVCLQPLECELLKWSWLLESAGEAVKEAVTWGEWVALCSEL